MEKRVPSPLLETSSIEKIMEIDSHIGCAMSGLTADARTMVDHARVTSQMHAFTYDEPIGVESCTQAVCDLALRFGESVEDDDALMVSPRGIGKLEGGLVLVERRTNESCADADQSRPFGVALLIAGIDERGPQLSATRSPVEHLADLTRYHTDPSGTFVRYDAKAIGSGSDAAQQSLQDEFHKVSCLPLLDQAWS